MSARAADTELSLAHRAPRWFAVQSQAGREELAALHLRRQAYSPFVPWTQRTIRHARKLVTRRESFFPGYLFVPLDLARDRWRAIDSTIGVLRLVKANAAPLAAPKGLVEDLIARSEANGLLDRAGALKAGDHVRVLAGPFAEHLARVEAMSGAERVRVLLNMMQQSVPVEIARRDLEACV